MAYIKFLNGDTPLNDTNLNLMQDAIEDTMRLRNLIPSNAGAHNAFYRGEDITTLFYDGTLSTEISAGTFEDIFIGDYITGQSSGLKYLVADINYRLKTGDTTTSKPHILMIPELSMGTAKMNSSNTTAGAYISSEMYTTNLETYRTTIRTDFTIDSTNHILTHKECFHNAVTNGWPSGGGWYDTDIDLMNEVMVYGSHMFTAKTAYNGSSVTVPYSYSIDTSQLALFKFRPDLKTAYATNGTTRQAYWLRDIASATYFTNVSAYGSCATSAATTANGVRPAFLVI